MTGFTNWLRKVFRLKHKDRWEVSDDDTCKPARLKLSVRGQKQVEVKVEYFVNPLRKKQLYHVEAYIFFAKELESYDLGFYQNLWKVVRLHTPKASMRDLAQIAAPGNLLSKIKQIIQDMQLKTNLEQSVKEVLAQLLQLMRLHCCMLRHSLRHQTSAIHKAAKDIMQGHRQAPKPAVAHDGLVSSVVDLVQHTVEAIELFQTVCSKCDAPCMPSEAVEAWRLCDEFLLCEAERALLKLLMDMDHYLKTDSQAAEKEDLTRVDIPLSPRLEEMADCMPFASATPPVQRSPSADPLVHANRLTGSLEAVREAAAMARRQAEGKCLTEAGAQGQLQPSGEGNAMLTARDMLSKAIAGLQEARRQCGYSESIIYSDDPFNNEKFTNRIKVLKRHAQAAISLTPRTEQPSTLLADVVGMLFAALAMAVAVFTVWIAQRYTSNTYGPVYLAVLILGYVAKDRIKEWGKRYLQPTAAWFGLGFFFPDRIVNVVDDSGRKVGQSREYSAVKEDSDIDSRVLQMRWRDSGVSPQRHAIKPERVLHYRKAIRVRWDRLDPHLRGFRGMDDVMLVDLRHLMRRMAPAVEAHYCLQQTPDGPAAVKKECARVYHLNLVLRIRSNALAGDSGSEAGKSMQLQRARLVVNQDGILRLERLGSDMLEKPANHTLPTARLSIASVKHMFGADTVAQPGERGAAAKQDVELGKPNT